MTGLLRGWCASVLAVIVAASLASCTEEQKPVVLPSLTPSTATPTSTVGMTDKDQIEWIYAGYARGVHKAQRIEDLDERRIYLQQWMNAAAAKERADGIEQFLKAGYRTEGTPIPHVARSKVSGQTAWVQGCTDEKPLITKNLKTGKASHGAGIWRRYDMERTNRGWRIYAIKVGKKLCDPAKY